MFVIPFTEQVQAAESYLVEGEVFYFQVGVQHTATVQVAYIKRTCGFSGELQDRDIQYVENIAEFNLFQVHQQSVCRVFGNASVQPQVLLLVGYLEVVDIYPAIGDGYFRRIDLPDRIVEDQRAFVQGYIRP